MHGSQPVGELNASVEDRDVSARPPGPSITRTEVEY